MKFDEETKLQSCTGGGGYLFRNF